MRDAKTIRVAWLYPAVPFGAYWQPVINEFAKFFQQTTFYTGLAWKGFNPDDPKSAIFKVVGKAHYNATTVNHKGYGRSLILASPTIIFPLLRSRPHIIFASAFSIWTLLALLLKPIGGWQIVIIYDGSTLNADFRDSPWRTVIRKKMASAADALLANSQAAKQYFIERLAVPEGKIFTTTYLVPDVATLVEQEKPSESALPKLQHPVFLYVGQLILRKGVHTLLQACSILKNQGYENYSVLIVGDGAQRKELEEFVRSNGLEQQITWTGWIDYGKLGTYFRQSDVFVFPSLEDVWGMVVLEAMVFGKPVLCSTGANASELVINSVNGYTFEPSNSATLAQAMRSFIERPKLVSEMGCQSQQLISDYTPKSAAKRLSEIAVALLGKQDAASTSNLNVGFLSSTER